MQLNKRHPVAALVQTTLIVKPSMRAFAHCDSIHRSIEATSHDLAPEEF